MCDKFHKTFLVITFKITPLNRLYGMHVLADYRTLHLTTIFNGFYGSLNKQKFGYVNYVHFCKTIHSCPL